MAQLFTVILIAHIVTGAASLVLFWIPVAVKKGGAVHIRTGHWYARCMNLVAVSALILSVMIMIDPIGIKHSEANLSTADAFAAAEQRRSVALFLLAISVLVIANIRHGLLTLGEGLDRQKTRALDHTLLNGALITLAIVLAIVAYRQSSILFYVFTGLCSATAYTNLRYAWRPKVTRGDRIQSHLASMIGAGIASHTAFFVFGANRFLSDALSGHWQLVPWVAPAVVGTIIINRISRRYVRKPRRSTSHA